LKHDLVLTISDEFGLFDLKEELEVILIPSIVYELENNIVKFMVFELLIDLYERVVSLVS